MNLCGCGMPKAEDQTFCPQCRPERIEPRKVMNIHDLPEREVYWADEPSPIWNGPEGPVYRHLVMKTRPPQKSSR